MKFALEAKPRILFLLVLGLFISLPFGLSAAGTVTNEAISGPREVIVLVTATPTPIAVITEGPATPSITPTTPSSTATAPTPPPFAPSTLTSTVIVEPVDLAPILDAINGISVEVIQEGVDLEAILAAIEAGFSDIVIEITIDETTEIICDTRGQGCEEPPFGRGQ